MGRIVFRSMLLFVVLVAAAAKDIPISSSYVIRHTDSCPDVGYYFRREPAPNSIDPGPCLLCFCQNDRTAACWIRESKRCDVEKYHLHRVGRETRVRRSPVNLGDILFRNASRDFFDKNLPEECKPLEESFSDGCPPADWCTGCTICDCDTNGRWDCHILSFCNDVDKKKIDGVKIPPPKLRRTGKKSGYRPSKKQKTTPRPKKKITPKPVKKTTKRAKKAIKKEIRKVVRKVNNENKTQNMNPKRRRIIIKRKANNDKIKQKRENPEQTIKDIVIRKEIATHKPMTISNTIIKGIPPYNITHDEYQLGQILVKRVMSSVQKLVQNELDKLNKTMEKLQDGIDCEEILKRNLKKKNSSNEFKFKKTGEEFRWMRNKRDVSQQPITSHYNKGIDTTTDIVHLETTSTSHSNRSNWITTPNLPLNVPNPILNPLNISKINNNVTKVDFKDVNNDTSKHEIAKPVNNTTNGINTVLDEKKEKYINFVTVENNTAINETKSINTTKQIKDNNIAEVIPVIYNANLNKIAIIKNYKYNIGDSSADKSNVIATTSTTNTPVNEKKVSNDYRRPPIRNFGTSKRHNLKKVVKKKFKDLANIYFPLNEIMYQKRVNQKYFYVKNKKVPKKYSTQKLKTKFNFLKYIKRIFNKIFFTKKNKYLQQKDDEYQILSILCENINACNINRKNRNILKYKIKKINVECNTIFKTMKIIKGLLHLINIPNISNTSDFQDDIRKLHIILKENNDNFSQNMSDTQKIQIEYVKRNTMLFTASVSRFTELLGDIIIILQKNKQETQRSYRNRFANNKNKNLTGAFEKIRKLLIKHNLVENTFIKQIYNMLTDVENRVNTNLTQVSGKQMNSNVIEDYSRSIIENLRKLKGLAQALSSSRNKREALREDNTVEYLLLLMEYLIKKDQPTSTKPVNDGIDLLIDTIKSAPDIKSIKKKVLENISSSSGDKNNEFNDSLYESNTVKKNVLENISSSSGDKENEINDSLLYESNSISKETNVSVIEDLNNVDDVMRDTYEKNNLINAINANDYYDNVTNVPFTPVATIVPEDKEEKTVIDQLESLTPDTKKYDTFILDDEETEPTVTDDKFSQSDKIETTPVAELFYEFQETTTAKIIDNQSGENLGNLEWIEENFGNDIREIRQHTKVKNETVSSTTSVPIKTTSTAAPKNIVDISDISEENNKKKEKELTAEEVMRRKEIDLLNSLDYGTPRSDFDETKSEDDEKFNSDPYF